MVRFPLTTDEKQVSDEAKKTICRPESASCEARQTSLKSILDSTETQITLRQHLRAAGEAKIASRAIWIAKSNSAASCEAKSSMISTSDKAHKVSA